MSPERPVHQDRFPKDWDVFLDLEDRGEEMPPETSPEPDEPLAIPLLTAAFADLVAILVPCTAALIGLRLGGLPVPLAVAPWALGLGAAWWILVAAILLRIRRGTPGLLAANLVYREAPSGPRLVGGLFLGLAAALTLGLPFLLFRGSLSERLEALDSWAD